MDHHLSYLVAQLSPVPSHVTLADVQPIPSTPWFERSLFEQPLMLMALLVIAGVAGAIACVRRGKRRLAPLPLALGILLAVGSFAIASSVQTDRETCMKLTRDAVKHVVAADAASLGPMLRSDLVVRPFGFSRDYVLSATPKYMKGTYAVKSSTIESLTAVKDDDSTVRTQMHIRVTPENFMYNYPVGSWWVLTWQRSSDGATWLLTQIECQQMDRVTNLGDLRP